MNIIFHPSFDHGYYINFTKPDHQILGTKIVGIAGLLEHLSLHNGLSGNFASDGERASVYLSHVNKYTKGTMIETSFKNDALGVTKCLLHWRDLLIMAGWDSANEGDETTPKLQLLSKIESSWKAEMKGSADRWQMLAQLAKKHSLINENDVIECKCAKETLPLLVQDVLESCHATFENYPAEIQIPESLKIRVEHYNELTDAYRQVAAHLHEYENTVIINRDNVSLNHILFSWGRPLVGATIKDSNPLTLQLFKLAMSVFSRPLNIQNILSYLQLPVGPVPRKLRSKLANILVSDSGFGNIDWKEMDEEKTNELKEADIKSKWELAIYDYINEEETNEENKLTKEQKKSKSALLAHITDPTLGTVTNIPTELLINYISNINKWALSVVNNKTEKDETLKSQLSKVVSYFKQLSDILDGIDEISFQDLDKHIRTIYQPTTITQAHAQVGSLKVIDNCSQLIDTPENLLWLDCCEADVLTDPYDFLSTTERTWLNNQEGIVIPKHEDILNYNRKEMIAALSKISGNITLAVSSYHHNKRMTEHPLIAELKMVRGERLEIMEGNTVLTVNEKKEIKLSEPQLQYELGPINYKGRNESNTSIDTLINYPFDYTVNYIARLKEPSDKEIGSLGKIRGTAAHSFIEALVDSVSVLDKEQRINEMSKLLDNEFEIRLENAVTSTGLPLLLKENEVEYNNFRFQLKRSIEVLITIMKVKHLTPVGCEMKYDGVLDKLDCDFNARIDMVLEDAQGDMVIFDFKWTYSDFYGNKIKESKAIQLELYRKVLEQQGKKVSAVGYYLMPKCVLETASYPTLKDGKGNIIIDHIEPLDNGNLFEQILNSIEQRKIEILEKGSIEEGEEMDIKDLPYTKELQAGRSMMAVGKQKPRKAEIIKDSYRIFKNKPELRFINNKEFEINNTPHKEKPTTYPLMKGRLK